MSHLRRFRGSAVKVYNSENCDDCDSAVKLDSGSKLSQGPFKSDAASVKRSDDKESLSDERRVLLACTVEIDDGCVEHIQLREGDSAEAVAMKFCLTHALPEQFVAPLTEHIVSNIISLSKEDSDIVFHSQDESMSNDENSTLHFGSTFSPVGNSSFVSLAEPRIHGGRPGESNDLMARREARKMDVTQKLLQASQKVNRHPGVGCFSSWRQAKEENKAA